MILLLLGILFTILSPYFLLARNFANVGTQIASVAIGAFGMTFVITTGGIDLSIGSILALTSIFTGILISTFHWNLGVTIAAILLMGPSWVGQRHWRRLFEDRTPAHDAGDDVHL